MTDEIPYTTEDYKKCAFATGKDYIKRIQEIVDTLDMRFGFDTDTSEDLMSLFENAVDIYLYRAAFFDNHLQGQSRNQHQNLPELEIDRTLDVYSHGRRVNTSKHYGEGEDEYVTHVWHPDPAYPGDEPGTVIEFSQGPYPFRYRYATVLAPGVLSEVRNEEDWEEEL